MANLKAKTNQPPIPKRASEVAVGELVTFDTPSAAYVVEEVEHTRIGMVMHRHSGGTGSNCYWPEELLQVRPAPPPRMVVYHGGVKNHSQFDQDLVGRRRGSRGLSQAWGYYFSHSESAAEQLRTSDSDEVNGKIAMVRRAKINREVPHDLATHIACSMVYENRTPHEAVSHVRNHLTQHRDLVSRNFLQLAEAAEAAMQSRQSKVFTVSIPDESLLLDWDKPLDQQPEQVRRCLEHVAVPIENPSTTSGEQLYRALSQELGGDTEASECLAEAGIPGMRYRCQAAGGAPGYVVFSAEDIRSVGLGAELERLAGIHPGQGPERTEQQSLQQHHESQPDFQYGPSF